jgi:hypothetical protein
LTAPPGFWLSFVENKPETLERMVPLYAARIQDLGPGDFVKVECTACRHVELLAPDKLRIKGVPLPPYTPVLDLERQLRCRECDAKGKAVVSVRWWGKLSE